MRIACCMVVVFMFQQFCFSQAKIHWKIYDQNSTIRTEITAKDISIAEDLIWYKTNGKYGVKDMHNTILIKPKYENINHYQGGFTSVGNRNCFGMVYKGKEILPLEYSYIFAVDSSGYFRAQHGCSQNPEAYIIPDYSIHDATGKLVSQDCEDDINRLFVTLTGRYKKNRQDSKALANGFSIKMMPSDRYVRKGIYNSKDSLIFSCTKCTISDNIHGEFFIKQMDLNKSVGFESYTIDTLGRNKIKDGYDRLYYNQSNKVHLYERGSEKGRIDINGNAKVLVTTKASGGVEIISKNNFLLSISDSSNALTYTICDSLGNHLFTPTKDWFQIVDGNCLIHKTPTGYIFTDAKGKSISNTYDSVFVVPDFNYIKMVLGDDRPRVGFGSDVRAEGPLDRDGFSPGLSKPRIAYFGIIRDGKMGLFDVGHHKEIHPQYSVVAKLTNELFVARKDNQWLTINDAGDVKSYGKSKYFNFFENYVLIGN